MPLVANTVVPATWGFVDNNNKVSTTSLYLPPSLTLAATDGYVTDLGTAMDALSNAGLNIASWSRGFFDDLVTAQTAPPESEVERKLVLVFGTANRYVDVTIEIPSPVFTIETTGTDEVPVTNPLVAALADLIINGPVGVENGAIAASGLPIISIRRAYIRHRSRRVSR